MKNVYLFFKRRTIDTDFFLFLLLSFGDIKLILNNPCLQVNILPFLESRYFLPEFTVSQYIFFVFSFFISIYS